MFKLEAALMHLPAWAIFCTRGGILVIYSFVLESLFASDSRGNVLC